jgi:hypothetical protein
MIVAILDYVASNGAVTFKGCVTIDGVWMGY